MGYALRRATAGPDAAHRAPFRRFLLAVLLLGVRPAAAQECDPAICVGNPCTIADNHSIDDECSLDFGTKSVIVSGILSSAVDGGSFKILAGSFTLRGKLEALGGGEIEVSTTGDFTIESVGGSLGRINVNSSGAVTISAGGNVTLGNQSNITALGKDDLIGGDLLVEAGGTITSAYNSTIDVDGNQGGDGGTVKLLAGGDATIQGSVTADGAGQGASGGYIEIRPGIGHNLTVTHSLEANTVDSGFRDGEIKLGPACAVSISGTVRTRNPSLAAGRGLTVIEYSQSADLGQATLLADDNAGNHVYCRCVDTNHDAVCDGGCVQGASGLTQGTKNPAVVVAGIGIPPCGCGNGVVDTGEDCDDANTVNFDGCRYDCKQPGCGDGLVDAGEQCDHGSLNGTANDCCTSTCLFKATGSSCSDGNVCTQSDQCNGSGACSGSPVTCTPLDQCHLAGTCTNPSGCSNPNKTDGTPCDDGNACTLNEVCVTGICRGACNTGAVCGSSCGGSLHCGLSGYSCVCQ